MFSKKQTNGFFNVVQSSGFSIGDFAIKSEDELLITHLPTGFNFKVAPLPANGRIFLNNHHTPDNRGLVAIPNKYRSVGGTESWEATYSLFSKWLDYIKEEEDLPDLWAEAATKLATDAASAEKFTPTEAKRLQQRLRELQAELSVLPISAEQRQAVAEVLAVEVEALNNLPTKQNWLQQVGQKITDKLVDKAADAVLDPTLKVIFAWLLAGLGQEFPELVAFVKHLLPH